MSFLALKNNRFTISDQFCNSIEKDKCNERVFIYLFRKQHRIL